MTSAIELLQRTAALLKQEGKQPSLALLKARLSGQLSAPELFSAYQYWRQHPQPAVELPAVDDLALSKPVTVNADLSLQLARIEQKLDRLLAIMEQSHVSG